MGRHQLGRAESLAITHGVPVVMVASGKHGRADGSGMSALIDGWGRHLHTQRGGKSAIVQVALPYAESNKERRQSGAEYLGTRGVLGAGVALISVSAAVSGLRKRLARQASTDDSGERVPLVHATQDLMRSGSNDSDSFDALRPRYHDSHTDRAAVSHHRRDRPEQTNVYRLIRFSCWFVSLELRPSLDIFSSGYFLSDSSPMDDVSVHTL